MAEFASNGKANAGLATGIIGTSIGGLLALGSGLLNGNGFAMRNGCCAEDHLINRYDLQKEQDIAKLETENSLLRANIYTDQKLADLYERLDSKIRVNEAAINQQAVYNATNNATNTSTIACLQNQVACLQALTKVVIPGTNICPEAMPRYNSWTAPTAPAAAA